MAINLLRLKRNLAPDRLKDVVRMRAVLTAAGYEAPDGDIEAAYAAWSKSIPGKPDWHPLSYLKADELLKALLTQLEPVRDESTKETAP
jgi:hypothetical protein